MGPRNHDRKLALCGVSLTKARLPRYTVEAATLVREELERAILDCHYLEDAPFEWVTIALRYGLKNDEEPQFRPISKKYGDLPLAIEVDVHELGGASSEETVRLFKIAVLKALISAGRKFRRPHAPLESKLAEVIHDSTEP